MTVIRSKLSILGESTSQFQTLLAVCRKLFKQPTENLSEKVKGTEKYIKKLDMD